MAETLFHQWTQLSSTARTTGGINYELQQWHGLSFHNGLSYHHQRGLMMGSNDRVWWQGLMTGYDDKVGSGICYKLKHWLRRFVFPQWTQLSSSVQTDNGVWWRGRIRDLLQTKTMAQTVCISSMDSTIFINADWWQGLMTGLMTQLSSSTQTVDGVWWRGLMTGSDDGVWW